MSTYLRMSTHFRNKYWVINNVLGFVGYNPSYNKNTASSQELKFIDAFSPITMKLVKYFAEFVTPYVNGDNLKEKDRYYGLTRIASLIKSTFKLLLSIAMIIIFAIKNFSSKIHQNDELKFACYWTVESLSQIVNDIVSIIILPFHYIVRIPLKMWATYTKVESYTLQETKIEETPEVKDLLVEAKELTTNIDQKMKQDTCMEGYLKVITSLHTHYQKFIDENRLTDKEKEIEAKASNDYVDNLGTFEPEKAITYWCNYVKIWGITREDKVLKQ